MSKFVYRDENSKIGLVFAERVQGLAEEELEDDNPELVAFLSAMEKAQPNNG